MPISAGSAGGLPGVTLKAWAVLAANGTVIRSYNVASVTKGATGNYTMNFTAAMSSTNYFVVFNGALNNAHISVGFVSSRAVGSAGLRTAYLDATSQSDADIGGLWQVYE